MPETRTEMTHLPLSTSIIANVALEVVIGMTMRKKTNITITTIKMWTPFLLFCPRVQRSFQNRRL